MTTPNPIDAYDPGPQDPRGGFNFHPDAVIHGTPWGGDIPLSASEDNIPEGLAYYESQGADVHTRLLP